MAKEDKNFLIHTPTWIIAVVCAIIVLVSLAAERGLHHLGKIEKLKVLCESLSNSSTKSEKRISDTRSQREEALKFRVSKESEVGEISQREEPVNLNS